MRGLGTFLVSEVDGCCFALSLLLLGIVTDGKAHHLLCALRLWLVSCRHVGAVVVMIVVVEKRVALCSLVTNIQDCSTTLFGKSQLISTKTCRKLSGWLSARRRPRSPSFEDMHKRMAPYMFYFIIEASDSNPLRSAKKMRKTK